MLWLKSYWGPKLKSMIEYLSIIELSKEKITNMKLKNDVAIWNRKYRKKGQKK